MDSSLPASDENRPPAPEPTEEEQNRSGRITEDNEETQQIPLQTQPPRFIKDNKHRVKLYVLNEQRSWDDKGTGHVACTPAVDGSNLLSLIVRSENDGESNVLESKILHDTTYQKQQETLIVWSESDACDLALSFQEKSGCDEIWENICLVQGKDPSNDITQDVTGYEQENDESDQSDTSATTSSAQTSSNSIQLPACELSRLQEIEQLFNSCLHNQSRRENLAFAIEQQDYIPKLCTLFQVCEDLEDNSGSLQTLYHIIKSIFILNKNALLEILFNEKNLYNVVGILEYDPAHAEPRKHREYLWKNAKFKEVIPIKSAELRAKIHQTYRVQYIQDVILPAPSIFEENMLSALNSYVFFNRVEVVTLIQDDEKFLFDLFGQLKSKEIQGERRQMLTLFLKEYCTFAQTLQPTGPTGREAFFKSLMTNGVLCTIEQCLQSGDSRTRAAAIEIFAMVVDHSAHLARDYLLTQGKRNDLSMDKLLINQLIGQIFTDPDPELSSGQQLLHVLKLLVDPDNMMTMMPLSKTDKTEFLSFFYKKAMNSLVKPLMQNTEADKPIKDDYHTAHRLSLVLELLGFCIEHHNINIRTFILNKELLKRVIVLLRSRHSFLALCALRLFRKVVQLKDESYNRHIIRLDLFKYIVDCYKSNGSRYNLMNSALLELFEFIRTEDIKSLLLTFVEKYGVEFESVDYVRTFENLKIRYDQHRDREKDANRPGSPLNPTAQQRERREVDRDEEGWFNEEEEDLNDSGSRTPPVEIVGDDSMSSMRKDSAQFFPSVVKRKSEDEAVGNLSCFSPIPARKPVRPVAPQKIVFKMAAIEQNSTAAPIGKWLNSLSDQVVSSTQLAPSSTTSEKSSISSPVIFKLSGGLVDYDVGDSDSDEEDTKFSEKPTSTTKTEKSNSDGSHGSDSVSSTSGNNHSPVRKKLRMDDEDEKDMETC